MTELDTVVTLVVLVCMLGLAAYGVWGLWLARRRRIAWERYERQQGRGMDIQPTTPWPKR